MQRPPHSDPGDLSAIDEGTDAYDTIEWLLKNVSGANGRVGMLGLSYGGWLTTMATLAPHPALKADGRLPAHDRGRSTSRSIP
jgi:dienelactone hydrolase